FGLYLCIPKRGTIRKFKGILAQLVQSTCLTSRGSLVRIQQVPLPKKPGKYISGFFYWVGIYRFFRYKRGLLAVCLGYDEFFGRLFMLFASTPRPLVPRRLWGIRFHHGRCCECQTCFYD